MLSRTAKTVKTAKTVMKATPLKLKPPFPSSCFLEVFGGFRTPSRRPSRRKIFLSHTLFFLLPLIVLPLHLSPIAPPAKVQQNEKNCTNQQERGEAGRRAEHAKAKFDPRVAPRVRPRELPREHPRGLISLFSALQGLPTKHPTKVSTEGATSGLKSRPGKPNQRKGQNEKFMNFTHFCEFWCFSLGKRARFTLNFCSGMPLRKVHELAFLWFGLPG